MKLLAAVVVVLILAQANVEAGRYRAVTRTMPVLSSSYPIVSNGERIINGAIAKRGQFPYQAGIVIDGSSFCGGSIISEYYVLTAGHCTIANTGFQIHLGAQLIHSNEEGRVILTTVEKKVHPNYSPSTLHNDLALLRLPRSVAPSEFIQYMRLPRTSDVGETFVDTNATVSGWGRVAESSTEISDELRFVELPVISNDECVQFYGETLIADTTICGSGEGPRSTCNGDSGGPLAYIEDDGEVTQIGIVSFGSSKGCASEYPVGFTRVTEFLDWIADNSDAIIRP